jgi:hypothetical protein
MSEVIKRKFKCEGCGIDRPCIVTTNQEESIHPIIEDLNCILDKTNQTGYSWEALESEAE